jgi:hypothetical protein
MRAAGIVLKRVCFKRRDDTMVGEDWRKCTARKIA